MKKSLSQVLILSAALLLASCQKPGDSKAPESETPATSQTETTPGTSEAGTSTPTGSTSTPAGSTSTPTGTSTPVASSTPASSEAVQGNVAFSGIDIIEEGGKAYAKLTGTISDFANADAMKMAFGLVSGETYIMGSATPAAADYKYAPVVTNGAFELKVDLSGATLAQGDYTVMCGPKGHYASVGGQQSGMTYGTGKAVANGFRFSVRSHNGAIALDELPPIAMTISRLEIEGEGENAKIYHIVGGQLNTSKMTQAAFEALTPLMVYETTVSGWHQYKSNTSGAELTTTVSVDAQGNALIKTDITSLPNDKYNIKVNLDNTVTQYADTKMDVVIDTSANPVIFGGHEYVCYADSSKSAKDDIYGNCGLIITSHISYTAGTPFGDVTPWSDPNATPSTYYEMYPNATNTPNLEVTGNNAYKMNSGKVSTYDVTGLPAGEYEVYVKAKTSNPNSVGFSVGEQMDDNGSASGGNAVPGRYWVQAGAEGEKVYTDTGDKLYSGVGLNASSMEWTTEAVVKSVMIPEGTTSFKFGHTNAGYSISYEAIRLVRIGSYMLTTNIAFDENGAAKVEAEAYSLKHTIFTNSGEETDYTANYSYNEVTYPTNLDGSIEDDAAASGGKYLHGLYRQGWNQSKGSNMSGEVVYRIKLTEEAKIKIKARIKSNMTAEKVCFDLKVDGARKATFNSADAWVEVESPEMTLSAGVHLISFVGQQLSSSENFTSVLGDLDWFELDKIPVPTATLNLNYTGVAKSNYSLAALKATDDGKVPELPTPFRPGAYKFVGWYTEAEAGTKVEAGADLTADTTLYAHWEAYTWVEGTKSGAMTPETSGTDTAIKLAWADHADTSSGFDDTRCGSSGSGTGHADWDVTGIEAGTYAVQMSVKGNGSNDNVAWWSSATAAHSRYYFQAGDATVDAPKGMNYEATGLAKGSGYSLTCIFGNIEIAAGTTTFQMQYDGSGYRLYGLEYVRLIKVA